MHATHQKSTKQTEITWLALSQQYNIYTEIYYFNTISLLTITIELYGS